MEHLLTSQHFQISLEYHSIFEIVEYIKILEKYKEELVSIVSFALKNNLKKHWHHGVKLRSAELLSAIDVLWKQTKKSKLSKKKSKSKRNKHDKNQLRLDIFDSGEDSSSDDNRRKKFFEAFSPKATYPSNANKLNETRLYSPVRKNLGSGFFQIFSKLPIIPSTGNNINCNNYRLSVYSVDEDYEKEGKYK